MRSDQINRGPTLFNLENDRLIVDVSMFDTEDSNELYRDLIQ